MQQPKMFLLQVTLLLYALFKESYDISLLLCNCNLHHPFSLFFFFNFFLKSLILNAIIGNRPTNGLSAVYIHLHLALWLFPAVF